MTPGASAKIVRRHTLANGLELLGEVSPASQSAALGFFVKTGSRDELPEEGGISHFLEHMMFKGTAKRSALDLTYALGAIGAQVNAYTTEECTVYYAGVMPEYFAELQEILGDMLRPVLDGKEFDTEKKVILEEIALYLDRPNFWLYEQACLDYYHGHPAGNSVLGSQESVAGITPAMMEGYFGRRYAPGNMVCAAAGRFDWETFAGRAEEYCGGWRAFDAKRDTAPFPARETARVYGRKPMQQAHLLFLSEGACAQEPERFAFAVLAAILGDATGSKLYWELIDKGLAETAGCENEERDGTGAFSIYASTAPPQADQVADTIRRAVRHPLDFSDDELEQARRKLAARLVLGGELPVGRLMALGGAWLYRKEMHDLRAAMEKIKAIGRPEIAAALEKYPLRKFGEYRLIPEG